MCEKPEANVMLKNKSTFKGSTYNELKLLKYFIMK